MEFRQLLERFGDQVQGHSLALGGSDPTLTGVAALEDTGPQDITYIAIWEAVTHHFCVLGWSFDSKRTFEKSEAIAESLILSLGTSL